MVCCCRFAVPFDNDDAVAALASLLANDNALAELQELVSCRC
jgi:hypothetical protein